MGNSDFRDPLLYLERKILKDNLHTVEADWREADAMSLEIRVRAVSDWLDHTEDLVEMFDGDTTIASELRGVAGTLRSRRNDFEAAANKLRAETNDKNGRKM